MTMESEIFEPSFNCTSSKLRVAAVHKNLCKFFDSFFFSSIKFIRMSSLRRFLYAKDPTFHNYSEVFQLYSKNRKKQPVAIIDRLMPLLLGESTKNVTDAQECDDLNSCFFLSSVNSQFGALLQKFGIHVKTANVFHH